MIDLLNKKEAIPHKITSIKLTLDVAMYNTGFSLWINDKLFILDTIKTPAKKDSIGDKLIADGDAIFKWLAKNKILGTLNDIQTLGFKKVIDLTDLKAEAIIENGIVINRRNLTTIQKLSIWTGFYVSHIPWLFYNVCPAAMRQFKVKIISPSQWIGKISNTQDYNKDFGIQYANDWLKANLGHTYKVASHDEAEALIMGIFSAELVDQVEKYKQFREGVASGIKKAKKTKTTFKIN